jgi:P27 family predicted phage terminase small subunit
MPGGRPPKPTTQKKLGGTLQPSRTNKHEPVPDVALPPAPDWLSERGRRYWDEIGAVLLHMKVVTFGDGPAFSLLVESLAEWAEARQAVIGKDGVPGVGLVYEMLTESGQTMRRPNPEVAQASDAMKRALRMLTEFGLTPSSRSKVSALGGDDGNDPFADMMNDMKG